MSQLDTYRNTLLKKQEDISKLNQDMAKEQAKIAPLQKKIISAKGAISRTKSQSTIKSKLNEIERAEKSISDIQKKCGDIQKKIAQKEKERSTAEKNYRNEEAKVEKKRQQDAIRQAAAFERSLKEYGNVQSHMQLEIERLKAIPEKITVLFLAANPKDTPQLSLDEEARSIQEKSACRNIVIRFILKVGGLPVHQTFCRQLMKRTLQSFILVVMVPRQGNLLY